MRLPAALIDTTEGTNAPGRPYARPLASWHLEGFNTLQSLWGTSEKAGAVNVWMMRSPGS